IAVMPPASVGDGPSAAAGQAAAAEERAVVGSAASAGQETIAPIGDSAEAPHARPILLVRAKRPKGQRDRIVTFRVVVFVLLFVAVLGSAAGVVVWYNKASFFVGLDHGHVTIFQGRPGGLLWFKPVVVERTSLTGADLLSSNLVYLHEGMEETSYQAARNLVRGLSLEHSRLASSESTTTTTGPARATQTTTTAPNTFGAAVTPSNVTTTTRPK